MEQRTLGRTGVKLSVLGFGCGAVGGLMVRGAPADQERAVAIAVERGITYFDTAAAYGNGASETNVGRVLKTLKPNIVLSTKFTILPEDHGRIAAAITASLEASLKRLGRDSVDLFQLHNRIATDGVDRPLAPEVVLGEVVPALERLRGQGKIRFFGITALGETPALQRVVDARVLDSAQIVVNMLNPSAAQPVPPGFPAQDFAGLLGRSQNAGMGTIGIRVLAGGALSGTIERHPIGVETLEPIASGPDYATDVGHARRFAFLVKEGYAANLVEAALRFVIAQPALTTALVGTSTLAQLEHAIAAVEKGPLPQAALERLSAAWREFAR
jgi:aryl-alcohol dehydrogenase-like predicted oxidoreductase